MWIFGKSSEQINKYCNTKLPCDYLSYKIETVSFVQQQQQQEHLFTNFYRNECCAQQFPYTHLLDERFKLHSFPWFSSNFQQRKQSQWESSARNKVRSGAERKIVWNWVRLWKKGLKIFSRKRIQKSRRWRTRRKKRMRKEVAKRTR